MWKIYIGIFITISEQLLCAQALTLSHSEGHKQRREHGAFPGHTAVLEKGRKIYVCFDISLNSTSHTGTPIKDSRF